MMGKKDLLGRDQFQMVTLNSLVPQDHIIRKIDTAINLSFIYDLVKDLYSDVGKESIDPVVLIKITLIQYTFGIRSMRQTIKEIQTNVAYRWYLGYSLEEEIPHFSTFGKNYSRRFQNTDLFEQIFQRVIAEIMEYEFINSESIFIDGTHIKASANNHNSEKETVLESVKYYEKELMKEINEDRIERGKQACKKKRKPKKRQK
ncbi:transposase [Anaerovorax sp. IOR16]|uniref:transposase n=1 Tax=Anaerovorax sp. IOR16 TaxID=2773458 RepID=UPI003FA4A508